MTNQFKELRFKRGLSQSEFWEKVGVTQSGGSRYENDHSVPRPVLALIEAVHIHQIDLSKINHENAEAIRALLNGDLDAGPLQNLARETRELAAHLSQASTKASDLCSILKRTPSLVAQVSA